MCAMSTTKILQTILSPVLNLPPSVFHRSHACHVPGIDISAHNDGNGALPHRPAPQPDPAAFPHSCRKLSRHGAFRHRVRSLGFRITVLGRRKHQGNTQKYGHRAELGNAPFTPVFIGRFFLDKKIKKPTQSVLLLFLKSIWRIFNELRNNQKL